MKYQKLSELQPHDLFIIKGKKIIYRLDGHGNQGRSLVFKINWKNTKKNPILDYFNSDLLVKKVGVN